MSKVTSICGTPRGAGGMPSRMKRPSVRLSAAISRSPCSTWISTCGWLSDAVEKIWLRRVGIVVFFSISFVITPPRVSMPSESGVTSSSSTSFTSPASTPPWIAAPTATTSSGFTVWFGSLPKSSFTFCCTSGMRVEPPTSTTSSISRGGEARVRQRLPAGLEGAVDQVLDELLELGPRELQGQVLRAGLVRGDVGQVDVGARRARELDLGLLRGLAQPLQRHRILGEIDALVLLELGDQIVDHALVEVVAAQVGVAVGRLHLDDVLAHLEDRDVEGPAAEVVDGDLLVLLLVEPVGERRRRGLVDDALDVEAGDLPRRPWWPGAGRR